MASRERSFVPAAGHDWLLPLYDPLWRLLDRRESIKTRLIEQTALRPGHRVLDLGCGTGALAVLVKQSEPAAEVTGVDPDPKALAVAARKARAAGKQIRFDEAFGDALPYSDASFDRVLSSFMFHHLGAEEKRATLSEVRRVLAPGGSLHLLDFAPRSDGGRGFVARLLHAHHVLADNRDQRIVEQMAEAGLADPREIDHRSILFGRIGYFRATLPVTA